MYLDQEDNDMEQQTPGMPPLGDMFPEMTVSTTHGPMKLPEAYKGSWFWLFSHTGVHHRVRRIPEPR
jgi:hypothetical protein